MEQDLKIRVAKPEDAQALLNIYSYYVNNTAITYDYNTPTLIEFKSKITQILENYPYLVAESKGQIIGYAYAKQFQSMPAYNWIAELTIYLDKNVQKNGVGQKLYTLLESILKEQGIVKTISLITAPKTEKDKAIYPSMHFHEKMGYSLVGKINNCGYKLGDWHNTVLMDKVIGVAKKDMKNIKSFNEIRNKFKL